MTFLSPTLIAHDQSLVDTAAHEIGHSWFGNLVTNCNWSEFWLNEGLTMYAQRRIVAETLSKDLANLEAMTGQSILRQAVQEAKTDNETKLIPDITGMNPDCSFRGFSLWVSDC